MRHGNDRDLRDRIKKELAAKTLPFGRWIPSGSVIFYDFDCGLDSSANRQPNTIAEFDVHSQVLFEN